MWENRRLEDTSSAVSGWGHCSGFLARDVAGPVNKIEDRTTDDGRTGGVSEGAEGAR